MWASQLPPVVPNILRCANRVAHRIEFTANAPVGVLPCDQTSGQGTGLASGDFNLQINQRAPPGGIGFRADPLKSAVQQAAANLLRQRCAVRNQKIAAILVYFL